MQLSVIFPAAGAIAAALLGVVIGSILTRRAQVRQWLRDRQLEACLGIMRESNQVQFALRYAWRRGTRPDWIPWNESLVAISLVAHIDLVNAAQRIDEACWAVSGPVMSGKVKSEADWEQARAPLEAARLEFINVTRRHMIGRGEPLPRFVARPPLPDAAEAVPTDEPREQNESTLGGKAIEGDEKE